MRRVTLFDPPDAFRMRICELQEQLDPNCDRGRDKAELLLCVELSFTLMEYLRLDDEPVTALWAILSGMPLRHPLIQNLDASKRRAIANVRQIVPFSSRFAWLDALRGYIRDIPARWRNYDFDLQRMDDRIISANKRPSNQIRQEHQELYEQCLRTTLAVSQRERFPVQADTPYQFEARTGETTATMRVRFTQDQLDAAPPILQPWFPTVPSRASLAVRIKDLLPMAKFLDRREAQLAHQYDWAEVEQGHWVERFHTIHFHLVRADGTLSKRNAHDLVIDGFYHAAGMVASGKSTLALLLAGEVLLHRPDCRLTIVVGDVQSAIRLANQINWWFRDDPEREEPVAVPLLGRSTRDVHLRGFYASKDYQNHRQRGQKHWGERWLNTACALQALLSPEAVANELAGKPLLPGAEPCQNLKTVPAPGRKSLGPSHLCPFFTNCRSQQMYRDMVVAHVWITTPGAMAMSGLPRHLEARPIKLGELVYEQSDIVIFDEADTVIKWFDNVYAETVTLTNSSDGVFDEITTPTEEYMIANRTPLPPTQRWVGAERDAQQAVTATLTLLDQQLGHEALRDWIKRGYFTPNTLCYRFARRLAGLPEFDPVDTPDTIVKANAQHTHIVLRHFDELLNQDDPLQLPRPRSNPRKDPVFRLSQIMQQINSNGESASDPRIHALCKAWITNFFPDTEQKLAQLHKSSQRKRGRGVPAQDADTIDTIDGLLYAIRAHGGTPRPTHANCLL